MLLPTCAAAEIATPITSPEYSISIEARQGSRWHEGNYEVWELQGDCRIVQGNIRASSNAAIVWIQRQPLDEHEPEKVIAYLEDGVRVDFGGQPGPDAMQEPRGDSLLAKTWMGHFHSLGGTHVRIADEQQTARSTGLVQRADSAWHEEVGRAVQAAQFIPPTVPMVSAEQALPTAKNLRITSRSNVPLQWKSYPGRTPDEMVIVISGGAQAIVSGIENVEDLQSDVVTLEADRIVAWTNALGALPSGDTAQPVVGQWEFYLEGNIIFREGDRLIYADRMYYNITREYGTILNAEMLTPVKDYEGLMRLKADVLQQLDSQNFRAYGAALTSSRLGVPRYWFQSGEISLRDEQIPVVDGLTGQGVVDPLTGDLAVDHQMLATSTNNLLYVGGVPVFYWPTIATDLREPTFYVDGISVRNDSVFGTQVLLDWDVYQLLGVRQPWEGTEWTVSTDWLSKRGPAAGTNFSYERPGFLHLPGPTKGFFDAWGIHDTGHDNLGANRRDLIPEDEFRGRALWRHRQLLANGFEFTKQLGAIQERNTLEAFFEEEWDLQKDQLTSAELKQYIDNQTWSITAQVRLNDFFTQTERLPELAHTILGQSLLADRLTWHAHSHASYSKLRTAVPPSPLNPSAVAEFHPLTWEVPSEGIDAATRHEIDWPMDLGPAKVVPYAMGEAFYIHEDLAGQELTRLYGQLGVRASMPIWRTDPTVRNALFNLNGLSHKVTFDADLFWADANQDIDNYPLYERVDDDSVEFFRRTFLSYTFAGLSSIPLRFDERYYALRDGMQSWVQAPSTEIVDDLTKVKLGVRQRWQTKRGLPGRERIVDWIVLDVEGSLFPDADRDNFGESVGLLNYDFRWHLGDRVTLLSDGFADVFTDGLRTFSLGGVITRPARGSAYVGMTTIDGPINSNVLSASLSYRLSEKWILTGGGAVDFGPVGNIGESFAVTRVGESALIQLGANFDHSRDSFGVRLMIEPRFLPSSRLGYVGGVQIPPAGALGLE